MSKSNMIHAHKRANNSKGAITLRFPDMPAKQEDNLSAEEKADNNEKTAPTLGEINADDLVLSIVQAEIEGEDYTKLLLDNVAFLAFYEREGKRYFTRC